MKNKLLTIFLAAAFLVLAMAAPAIDKHEPLASQLVFNTKTVAVCEYGEENVYCHDELVVRCGENEYVLADAEEIVNCGGVALGVPEITAFAVFDSEWKDPRSALGITKDL